MHWPSSYQLCNRLNSNCSYCFIVCIYRRVTAVGKVTYDSNTDREGIMNPVNIYECDSNVSNDFAVRSCVHKYIQQSVAWLQLKINCVKFCPVTTVSSFKSSHVCVLFILKFIYNQLYFGVSQLCNFMSCSFALYCGLQLLYCICNYACMHICMQHFTNCKQLIKELSQS